VFGDFNARLETRLDHEETVLGRYVYGKGKEAYDNQLAPVSENRTMFMEYCLENDYLPMNTYFMKPPEHRYTYRGMGIPSFNEPWIPERYTVLDYVLAKRRWKNTIMDVEAKPQIGLNSIQKESDHAIVVAKIRIKLKKSAKSPEKEKTNATESRRFNKSENTTRSFSITLITLTPTPRLSKKSKISLG